MIQGAFGLPDGEGYYFWTKNGSKGFIPDGNSCRFEEIPHKLIVNDNACILFFREKDWVLKRHYDEQKIVVSRTDGDKSDPTKAFLTAYFLAKSGLSRTKANKFINLVLEDYERTKALDGKKVKKIKVQ